MGDNQTTGREGRTQRSPAARGAAAVVAFVVALCFSAASSAVAADADVAFIGAFDNPLYVAVAPGEPNLLFVVEQPGRIQVLLNEQRLPDPFLDIRGIVDFGGERGLLSVAFPPDYAGSGLFYVAFTNVDGDIEVDEFQRSSATQANPASRRMLLTIRHRRASNHNGGQLQFGPVDGLLYISTGDGGEIFPRGEHSRSLKSLLGKILRIDPRPSARRPYRIPSSNPYAGDADRRGEIFAYGLRNPWRFSFDGRRIIVADVGQGSREEINFLKTNDAAGVNFGWPQYEGDIVFDDDRPGPDPATFPMFTYDQSGGRCAVIGGYVVHDPKLPRLLDRYLYGDLCTGELRSFVPRVAAQQAVRDRRVGITLPGLSGFGQGFNGVIYATQIGGDVWRLVPS